MEDKKFKTFDEFYPYYMSFHSNRANRRMHFIGVALSILQLLRTIFFSFSIFNLMLSPLILVCFATSGHYFFEGYFLPPEYLGLGFKSDLKMCYEIATGKRPF